MEVYENLVEFYFSTVTKLKRVPDSYMIEDSLERVARWIEEEKERRALQLKVNEQKEDELKAIRDFHDLLLSKNINKLYLWTEKGAFLQAKSLNPQKAWGVYENLVKDFLHVNLMFTKDINANFCTAYGSIWNY